MNYLAHAYLSFGNHAILTGNMISDFVKGKKKFDYPVNVQQGITLHRMIDNFTDNHPSTKEAKQIFRPVVGLYAGAFIDIVYDHFLALDVNEFPNSAALETFAQNTYTLLDKQKMFFPERFAKMFPYMINQNWLFNYSTLTGIENSFNGLFRRAKYLEKDQNAFVCFMNNYELLRNCYSKFFPYIKEMAYNEYKKLMNENEIETQKPW